MDLPEQYLRLCNDDGMVSDDKVEPDSPGTTLQPDLTYLKRANILRSWTGRPPVEAFHCTGWMHAAGGLFICTSSFHKEPPVENPVVFSPVKEWTLGSGGLYVR